MEGHGRAPLCARPCVSPPLAAGQHMNRSQWSGISLRRLWPVGALAIIAAAFFALGLHRYLTLDMLREHRGALIAFTSEHPILSPLALGLVYVAVVACSLPGATVLTLTCGFLLGPTWGTLHAVTSATIGASILFVVAASSFGARLRHRAESWIGKLQAGFRKDSFRYLLMLRLIPVVPFFVVNLVSPMLGVPLRTFVASTFLGSAPGSFVYASFGSGLSAVLDSNRAFSPTQIMTPEIMLALAGLAALIGAPLVYRKLRSEKL